MIYNALLHNFNSASSKADVVTIDLADAPKFVDKFHAKGQRVVCYFSGTQIEDQRYDKNEWIAAKIAIPGAYANKSERRNQYVDIRNRSKLEPLLRGRFRKARSYGCDGVEVDNLGLYNHKDDIKELRSYTPDDTVVFATWLGKAARDEGISIGLKNVATISPKLEPYFDFAVVENCASSSNVCNYYTSFTKRNKAVFMVHYEDRGFHLSGSSLKNLINEAGGRKFTCVITPAYGLKTHSTTYNCSSGSVISGSGKYIYICFNY